MKFILIPPGEFTMGSTAEEIDEALQAVGDDRHWQECVKGEGPAHKVVLTRAFYLAVHEVTQKEYATVAGSNPSHFAEAGSGSEQVVGLGTANFPVEKVSWNDAAEFCAKLCNHEDLKPSYFRGGETVSSLRGMGYRLPTEAEWEFACRAGTSTRFWIGDKDEGLTAAGWFSRNSGGRTHEVEELLGNPFGLFDVHANVWEWVEDGWQAKYYERLAENGAIDPSYPFSAGSQRVLRGGDWHFNASYCRSSRRLAYEPTALDTDIGFRVALSADALRRKLPATTSSAAAATSANSNATTPTPAPAPTKTPDASPAAQPRAEAGTPASLLRRPSVPEGGAWSADAPSPAIAPFDEEQARKHQQAWADCLKLPLEFTNTIGMKFILIPPGEFTMGSTPEQIERAVLDEGGTQFWQDCVRSEAPQHEVVLTQPCYFSVHEVTQKEYEDIMGVNPSYFAKTGPEEKKRQQVANLDTANFPVEGVGWNDAAEFCEKLSKREQLKPFYFRAGGAVTGLKGTGYQLPTEAEWEFACRAGTTTPFWSGDRFLPGWFAGNSGGRTHEVAELAGNPFGLFDVHGNVWEWVEDAWRPAFYQQFADQIAIDPKCEFTPGLPRIFRGGDWDSLGPDCRSARRSTDPSYAFKLIGFRVALPAVVSGASR